MEVLRPKTAPAHSQVILKLREAYKALAAHYKQAGSLATGSRRGSGCLCSFGDLLAGVVERPRMLGQITDLEKEEVKALGGLLAPTSAVLREERGLPTEPLLERDCFRTRFMQRSLSGP